MSELIEGGAFWTMIALDYCLRITAKTHIRDNSKILPKVEGPVAPETSTDSSNGPLDPSNFQTQKNIFAPQMFVNLASQAQQMGSPYYSTKS